MKITVRLAYSQLKKNHSRTRLALVAIALSAALMTAVCSFVVSGNTMLLNFLGSDYGDYKKSYIALLLIPAILFGFIIVAMSVVVISNVFRVSADERMAQFGILKCVGATAKQISSTVIYESIILSAVGIPIGVVIGLFLALVGINVANIFLGELNDLVHIMINEIHLSLEFVFSWQALLIAAIICFCTVICSAWKPARKAARLSAVESVRGIGTIRTSKTKVISNPMIQKIFGYEGVLAHKNLNRNRKNFGATVVALTVGVVLFVSLGSLSQQARELEKTMTIDVDETVISDYTSDRTWKTNKLTGRDENVYHRPIDSNIGNTVTEKLRSYDGKRVFGMGLDLETYYTVLSQEVISDQMKEVIAQPNQESYELLIEIISLDTYNYELLCEKAGVPVGSTILLNHYSYNNNGTIVDLNPYLSNLQELTLMKADGSETAVSIDGVLTGENVPKELIHFNTNPVRLVVQQAEVRGYSWYSTPENEAEFINYANSVLSEIFPKNENASYMEAGFSTRVYKIDDYTKVMNIAISSVLVFMYSFVALLMFIGFTNVVSTMSTNVLIRAREFAVLQSVGITLEGLKKMLTLESVLCSCKALLIGLPLGIVMTYLINLPIRALFPVPYQFPWLSVLLCATGVFTITWIITMCAAHKLRNQNIIETICTQSGR